MISAFSLNVTGVNNEKPVDLCVAFHGKMETKIENNYPFCEKDEIVVFKKISVCYIVVKTMDNDGEIVDIHHQKSCIPRFERTYFIARYPSKKHFEHSTIQTEEEKERDRLLMNRYQKEITSEITEVFRK